LNYVADYTESGQNKNINLRVTKKSKQVLKQNRITATDVIKKGGVKITVC